MKEHLKIPYFTGKILGFILLPSYKFTNIITYIKLLQGLQNSKDSDKTSSRSFSKF